MSEPIPAEISIGGKIREDQVPRLCKAIIDEGVSLEWGDALFRPDTADELLAACQEHNGVRVLWLCADQANYGEFRELEKHLVREGIAFRRHSDAKYEFDAEVVEHRPGIELVRYSSDGSGLPLVSLNKLTSIAEVIDQAANTAEGQTAFELLRRLRNLQQLVHESLPTIVPPLESFEIVSAKAH